MAVPHAYYGESDYIQENSGFQGRPESQEDYMNMSSYARAYSSAGGGDSYNSFSHKLHQKSAADQNESYQGNRAGFSMSGFGKERKSAAAEYYDMIKNDRYDGKDYYDQMGYSYSDGSYGSGRGGPSDGSYGSGRGGPSDGSYGRGRGGPSDGSYGRGRGGSRSDLYSGSGGSVTGPVTGREDASGMYGRGTGRGTGRGAGRGRGLLRQDYGNEYGMVPPMKRSREDMEMLTSYDLHGRGIGGGYRSMGRGDGSNYRGSLARQGPAYPFTRPSSVSNGVSAVKRQKLTENPFSARNLRWKLDVKQSLKPNVLNQLDSTAARDVLVLFIEGLRTSGSPLTVHNLMGRFGSANCTREMQIAAGRNEEGVQEFIQRFPSLFKYNVEEKEVTLLSKQLKFTKVHKDEFAVNPQTSGDPEMDCLFLFRDRMLRKKDPWIPISSMCGWLSQTSKNIRESVGVAREKLVPWLEKHPLIFKVLKAENKVALKESLLTDEQRNEDYLVSVTVEDYKILMKIKQILQTRKRLPIDQLYDLYNKQYLISPKSKFLGKVSFNTFLSQNANVFHGVSTNGVQFISNVVNPDLAVLLIGITILRSRTGDPSGYGQIETVEDTHALLYFGTETPVTIDVSLFGNHAESLKTFFTVGEYYSFTASESSENIPSKWKATSVWSIYETFNDLKVKINGQVSEDEKEEKEDENSDVKPVETREDKTAIKVKGILKKTARREFKLPCKTEVADVETQTAVTGHVTSSVPLLYDI